MGFQVRKLNNARIYYCYDGCMAFGNRRNE